MAPLLVLYTGPLSRLRIPMLFGYGKTTVKVSITFLHAGLKATCHLSAKAHRERGSQRGEGHVLDQCLHARARDVRDLYQLQRGQEHLDGPHPPSRGKVRQAQGLLPPLAGSSLPGSCSPV